MRRVAVTGATGFVGANLTRRLLDDGHEVHVLLRPGHASWRIEDIRTHLHIHDVDIADRGAVDGVMRRLKPAWVFHLATHGAYSWQTDFEEIVRTNILGAMNLAEAAADVGVDVFVNTGSSSEYGYKDHAPSEAELPEPNSHYAVAKVTATMFCRFTAKQRGVRMPTLRLYSAYGPYEEARRLVPALVVKGLQSRLPPLANPDTARDYVHVNDVVDAYLCVATADLPEPGAVFNVGTGVQTTLRDMVRVTRDALGVPEEPNWGSMPDRSWDTTIWRADITRIRNELGWTPRYDVQTGLRETIAWFKAHPHLLKHYEREIG